MTELFKIKVDKENHYYEIIEVDKKNNKAILTKSRPDLPKSKSIIWLEGDNIIVKRIDDDDIDNYETFLETIEMIESTAKDIKESEYFDFM